MDEDEYGVPIGQPDWPWALISVIIIVVAALLFRL